MNNRELPFNIEAEQLLIGTILINNNLYSNLEDIIDADCFYEPVHQKIFKLIQKLIAKGIIASMMSLKTFCESDNDLKEVCNANYITTIVSKANLIVDIEGVAKLLKELFLRRQLISVGEEIVNTAYKNSPDTDALSQIEVAESTLFKLANYRKSEQGYMNISIALSEAMKKVETAYNNKSPIQGISSGFTDLDRLLGGLQNSDLVIIAARPSMGKTAFAINVAINACKYLAKSDTSVAIFSLEMSAEQIASRMLAMESGINATKIRSGMIKNDDFNKLISTAKELNNLKCFIDDSPALPISSLRNKIRRLCRKNNLGVVFIDYLQLLRGSRRYTDANRVQEVSEITQGLKAIAKEMNIPLIALSQLSRLVESREDKKPHLSDLRESGSIEQDADVVMFLYREAYYLMRKQPQEGTESHLDWQTKMDHIKNEAEIIIAKQRNGPIGSVKLHFDLNTTSFRNLAVIEEA